MISPVAAIRETAMSAAAPSIAIAPTEMDHICRQCYYSLRGNGTGLCPEYGTPYNPRDSRTFYDRRQVIRVREVGMAQKLLIWP